MRPVSIPLALYGFVAFAGTDEVDLGKRYRATLDWSEGALGRTWTCDPDDVWSLSGFAYSVGDDFKIATGKASVVFGRHDTDVLWAVLLPESPGELRSSASDRPEPLTSVWLRFNPALVDELFPRATVRGHGPPGQVLWGKRICAWKMNGSWQADNLPVVPFRKSVILDVETADGLRRFFSVDTQTRAVKYEPAFEKRPLPGLVPMEGEDARAALEKVWQAFDADYAMFVIKPQVNWARLREEYLPRAKAAKTTYEAAAVIAELLAKLEDLHVWVRAGDEFVPCFDRPRPLNASSGTVGKLVGPLIDAPRALAWSRTRDGIGYVNVYTLGNPKTADAFDEALEKLSDTWALVLDLRYNGGGDEPLAQHLAGRFVDRPRAYSFSRYRNGPEHDQLTDKLAREVIPRGPWRYASPVVVLIGPRTMSSAESFAFMLAVCPQVVTLGDRTAGASGNPRQVDAGAGIRVNLPRWLDLGPDGKPFETVGIKPAIRVEARPEDFSQDKDPVLQKALQHLRQQPAAERKPGKR